MLFVILSLFYFPYVLILYGVKILKLAGMLLSSPGAFTLNTEAKGLMCNAR
jgi:hypothetical protein